MKTMSEIYGIILASGQSVRMGTEKLLLPWRGVSLLEYVLRKTKGMPLIETKVVIPEKNENLKRMVSNYGCTPVYNRWPHRGLGSSLAIAIQSLPPSAEGAIILLGDQPTLFEEDIKKIWLTYTGIRRKQEDGSKIIIQTKYSNCKIGHPVLFSSHFFEELRALKGDKGGKEIIRKNASFLFLCHSENEYPKDIDTPYDYDQLVKGAGEG